MELEWRKYNVNQEDFFEKKCKVIHINRASLQKRTWMPLILGINCGHY